LSPDPSVKPAHIPAVMSRPEPVGPGCPFYARCPVAIDACVGETIPLLPQGAERAAACIAL
jgi:ABC-type dipeptide/oligopeptide/nickel transport system ATPase component